ncbi:LysM peptidoglycan-binding domain-containing protein [bacterium]|nr:LysM peptidoglycan-binding domain-containing protein [bacterium]
MRSLFILITLCSSILLLAEEKQSPQEYIEKYKDLAVIEMYRSGVPASITLAQGILESNSGNSRLAIYANNHFGIKCKGDWTGNVIYADDDAPDECFRAYPSVLASFQDHSEFLRANWRYHELFELQTTDYVGWCKGLRKAGYATNPKYDVILINLIDRYELHQYDLAPMPGGNPAEPMISQSVNNVPVIIADKGQTVSSIASQNDLRDRHIRKWNDLPNDAEIEEGDMVYLKPKRRRGAEEQHTVVKGEDMHSISQQYGIKLKHLYRKNRMDRGTEPVVGEVIYMQKKRSREDTVELASPEPKWEEKEEEFVNPYAPGNEDKLDMREPTPIVKDTGDIPDYHTVQKGDNIYRIAERYHVFEEDLLKWNKDLNPNHLSIGQVIYLKPNANVPEEQLAKEDQVDTTEKLNEEEMKSLQEDITVSGPVYHKVVKGDTVYNICKRYGISQDQLKAWNKLDSLTIYLGQSLQVSE